MNGVLAVLALSGLMAVNPAEAISLEITTAIDSDSEKSGSGKGSASSSIFGLKCPGKSDHSRKRKVQCNPPIGKKRQCNPKEVFWSTWR